MEQYLVAHIKGIAAALVIGAQRFRAALLIETVTESQVMEPRERTTFIERIWPIVEEANRDAPSHARLMKSHVPFMQPQKPMLRAGKGTVQRSGILKSYANEIDSLYRDADVVSSDLNSEAKTPAFTFNTKSVSECIKRSVQTTIDWSEFDESANFFEFGMDSLHALFLVRSLRRALIMDVIALSTVYTNPSVRSLTAAILRLVDQD